MAEPSMAEPSMADPMADHRPYQNPVAQLLCLNIKTHWTDDWINYGETYGLTSADQPELMRLVEDEDPQHFEGCEPHWSACIHALRALTQLDPAAGIKLYLEILEEFSGGDWLLEEAHGMGQTTGSLGIVSFKAFLATKQQDVWCRVAACNALIEVALAHPQEQATVVDILMAQLRCYREQGMDEDESEILNSTLVESLVRFKVVEAADLIAEVFAARDLDEIELDESMTGTWPAIQVALGLKQESDFPPEALRPTLSPDMQMLQEIAEQLQLITGMGPKQPISSHPLSFPSATPRKSVSQGFGTAQPSPTAKEKAKKKAKKKR
jgi:hypothetical protein